MINTEVKQTNTLVNPYVTSSPSNFVQRNTTNVVPPAPKSENGDNDTKQQPSYQNKPRLSTATSNIVQHTVPTNSYSNSIATKAYNKTNSYTLPKHNSVSTYA